MSMATHSCREDDSIVFYTNVIKRDQTQLRTVIVPQNDNTFESAPLRAMQKLMTEIAEPNELVAVADGNEMSAVQGVMDRLNRLAVYEYLRSVGLAGTAIEV